MKKERIIVKVGRVELNKGQCAPWLPANPRDWTRNDLDRMKTSLEEDPDWLQDEKAPSVVPHPGKAGRFVVFAGNMRINAAQELYGKTAELPVWVYTPEGPEDEETIRRRTIKDNGNYGSHNWDALANEWPQEKLEDWGIPVWQGKREMELGKGLTTEGREGDDEYNAFVEKFEQKLTTDDCYTPPEVYDVVRQFVHENIQNLDNVPVVRPFYPGGDYEHERYPEGCVVIDNPPFSLLSKILRFYHANGVRFFLFGPHLTLFSAHEIDELCYLPVYAPVEYENGAVVSTGFITNMVPGLKIWIPAGLRRKIREVQRDDDPIDEYLIPPCVITSARLGKLAGVAGCELKLRPDEVAYIKNLDSMEEKGKGLYGGGI